MVLLQGSLVAQTFPLAEVWTDTPLLHNDAAYHWYQMVVAKELFRTGGLVGYDPYFNAGYPGGVLYNWSGKFPAALSVLFGETISTEIAYKVHSFVAAVLAPAIFAAGLGILGLQRPVVIIGSILALLLWWASLFRWFHTAGMVSFVFASYVAVPYLGLVYRYVRRDGGPFTLVGLGVFGAIACFYHMLFPVPIIVGTVMLCAFFLRKEDGWRLLALITVPSVLSLGPNLVWLLPSMQHFMTFVHSVGDISPYQKTVSAHIIWRAALGIWEGSGQGAKIYPGLLVCSCWACFDTRGDKDRRRLAWSMSAAGAILVLYSALGGAVNVFAATQPNRFAPTGYLLLSVSAGIGAWSILARLWHRRLAAFFGTAGVAGAAAIMSVGYSGVELVREVSAWPVGRYGARPPEVKGIGERSAWIIQWLSTNTDQSGRVMFETSKGRIYDGARMAGYYAYKTNREFIGGPYPFMHFAGFWDEYAFGSLLEDIPLDRFREYLEIFNVRWIVVHSEGSKRYFKRFSDVMHVTSFRGVHIYQVDRQGTYFLTGSGSVRERGINRLVLGDLRGRRVLLSYHYVEGLRADPPVRIEGKRLVNDPNPFIELIDPPSEVSLFLK